MIIYSGPLHHRTLSRPKTSTPGDLFGRECELFSGPRNLSLSSFTGCKSLQLPVPQKNSSPPKAVGSNISKDTDGMFDEILNKYGKVLFRRNDQKPTSAEVKDDAERLSFAVAVAKVASDVKAADIKLLFVEPLVYWTSYFIIATAFSFPQIDAIGTRIRDLAESKYGRTATGDAKPNSWTLLDFGDVVVHIFLPQPRAFYNLEEFYANAIPIELPFEDQQPFRN